MRVEAKASKPVRRTEPATVTSTARRRAGTQPEPSPKPGTISAPPADAEAGDGDKHSRARVALTRAQAIRELSDRANQGNQNALAHLRQLLNNSPELWQHVGDL